MALTEKLALLITADGAGAVREFQKVGAAAEKELGKTEDRTKRVGGQMQATGVAMMGAGALIVGAMVQTAKASEEANVQHLKLDNTLKNSPQLANANKQAFLDQATAMQKLVVVDDEAIIGVQALLGQFGLTQKQITDMTPLVVDLSRKMGIDLDTAAKMVGKSVDGSAGALKKAGIVVDEAAFKTDHYGATMNALQQKVGGFAEAEGKTFAGQLEITKNRLHDVAEGVGVGAVDAFNKILGPVQAVAGKFSELDAGTQSTIGTIGAFAGVGAIAAGAASTLIGTVIKMKDNFAAAGTAIRNMTSGMSLVGGAASLGALAAVAAGVYLITKNIEDSRHAADKWVDSVSGSGTIPERIAKVNDELTKLQDTQAKVLAASQGRGPLPEYHNMEEIQPRIESLRSQLEQLNKQQSDAKNSADLTARGVDSLGNSIEDTKKATDEANQAWDRARSALKGYYDQAFGTVDAERALADSQSSLTETVTTNNQIQAGAFDNSTKAGRENRQAFEDVAKSALELAQNNIKAGGDIGQNTQMVNQQIDALRQQMIAHGFSALAVDNYIAKLNLTPEQVTTQFGAPGLKEAADNAERLNNALSSVAGSINLANSKGGVGSVTGGAGKLFPGRASGGPVMQNRPYLVGEDGPELVVPGASGTVIPARDTAAIMSGSGGGGGGTKVIENHITLHIDGKELVSAIQRHEVSIN